MVVEQQPLPGDVTRLLDAARSGDPTALDRLLPLVYDELRHVARRQLRRDRAADTLQATGLVHEAYLKLVGGGPIAAANRAHFMAIAARAMRQVLIDHARRRQAGKRGVGWVRTTLTGNDWSADFEPDEILALNDAIERLDPRQRQIVECRFFGGMDESEIAAALGVSDRTVRREWVKARAWLYRWLYDRPS